MSIHTPPLISTDLQRFAEQIVAKHAPGLPPIVVRVSARLTRSAGTYRPPGTISISRHFLDEHGLEATLPILRHEVAHHIVRWTARRRGSLTQSGKWAPPTALLTAGGARPPL